MMAILRRHPFLILGLMALALFFIGPQLLGSADGQLFRAFLRVIVIPAYLGGLLFSMVVTALSPGAAASDYTGVFIAVGQVAAGLTPYVLADYLLRRFRPSRDDPATSSS
jgi:hypothetical protein